MATAQVLLHRFYAKQSLKNYSVKTAARACILIASKIEEAPKHSRPVLNVFYLLDQLCNGKTLEEAKPLRLNTKEYIHLKDETLNAERKILKEFGFETYTEHPYKFLLHYLTILHKDKDLEFAQRAWNYLNDSLRIPLCLRFRPETIACACIYITAVFLRIELPETPSPWYELFEATKEDLDEIAYKLNRIYSSPKPKFTDLVAIESAKRKEKEIAREKERKEKEMEKEKEREKERLDERQRDHERDRDDRQRRDRYRRSLSPRRNDRERDRRDDRRRDDRRDNGERRDSDRRDGSNRRDPFERRDGGDRREPIERHDRESIERREPSERRDREPIERHVSIDRRELIEGRDDSDRKEPMDRSDRDRDRNSEIERERERERERDKDRERGKLREAELEKELERERIHAHDGEIKERMESRHEQPRDSDDIERRRREREQRFKTGGPVHRDSPHRYRNEPYPKPRE